jgi:fucose 4-O-acetylase-like acetyltransferase
LIYAFHMPLFFFLSGIFIQSKESLHVSAANKAISLLKPYVTGCLIGTLVLIYKNLDLNSDIFLGFLYADGNSLVWPWLWFLPCLYLSSVLALFLIQCTQDRKQIIFICVLFLLPFGYLAQKWVTEINLPIFQASARSGLMANGLPWGLDLIPIAVSFLLLGYLTPKEIFSRSISTKTTCLALLLIGMINWFFKPTLDMNERVFLNSPAILVTCVLSIYVCIEISKIIASINTLAKVFASIGSAGLFIYLFHFLFQAPITFKLIKIFPDAPAVGYVAGLVAGILFPYAIFIARNKVSAISFFLLPRRPTK